MVNDMRVEELMELGKQNGFDQVAMISVEKLVFNPEFRKYCEENVCGNYGANYACPPDCGTPQEMMEKAKKYEQVIVFQSITQVDDIANEEEAKRAKIAHTEKTRGIIGKLEAQGQKGLPVMASSCSLCSECKKQKDLVCPHQEQVFSCLSAYCIDACKLAEECEMDYWCGENKIAYFSLYFI